MIFFFEMEKQINKLLEFLFTIVTPGILILVFMFLCQLFNNEISTSKIIFFLSILLIYGLLFFYLKKVRNKNKSGE